MRRLVIAALATAALMAAVAPGLTAPPAAYTACAPGETGVTNGCAPFCLPGRYFDYARTGLCLPLPPSPPPPRPTGAVPQSVSQ